MPHRKSFIEKVKENIIVEIVALILAGSLLFFGNSTLKSMGQIQENRAKIILLVERDEVKAEQLKNVAISLGNITGTTQRLEIAISRLEEITKILYKISIK